MAAVMTHPPVFGGELVVSRSHCHRIYIKAMKNHTEIFLHESIRDKGLMTEAPGTDKEY